jgi:cell wall-associated NlpC family hydrolase
LRGRCHCHRCGGRIEPAELGGSADRHRRGAQADGREEREEVPAQCDPHAEDADGSRRRPAGTARDAVLPAERLGLRDLDRHHHDGHDRRHDEWDDDHHLGRLSERSRDDGAARQEVVARLLGLRLNHPAAQDSLELRPQDAATRAEAAYSAAQILNFGLLADSWQIAQVKSLAASFTLPQVNDWQRQILKAAFSKIGMPYIWGGTSDNTETDFGVTARGGYDCSGFVWRVYKLQSYANEGTLASTLQGRTTYTMSVEVPRAKRIGIKKLQPADVIFFGSRGPNSKGSQIFHTAIYVGNGWFIQSSDEGVALAQLTGWYKQRFAWGRRPLREAGLEP